MTIIISFKKDDNVWIACDRYITYGDMVIDPELDSKLVYLDNAIIGGCGDITIRNHLELFVTLKNNKQAKFEDKNDVMRFMISFKRYMKITAGLGEAAPNQVQQFSNTGFLVATKDKMFEVDEDCGVLEFDKFVAVGRGAEMAIALLEYLYQFRKSATAEEVTQKVLPIVYKYQTSCGGKWTLLNVTEEVVQTTKEI